MPVFSSLLAAAVFWVAFLVALLCSPGTGLQLPFSPGVVPGVCSKPGQQVSAPLFFAAFLAVFLAAVFLAGVFVADFLAVVMHG